MASGRVAGRVVRQCGLNPTDVAGELSTVNREADLLEGSRHVAKRLGRRSGYQPETIHAALDLLSARDELFISSLDGIKS
jgi:hypothetical protein